MADYMISAMQITVGLALLNVWLVRANRQTAYRGGSANNLREEFATYGLPPTVFYLVGFIKICASILLMAGLWYPPFVLPAALTIAFLMAGAVSMHFRVHDPLKKALPASTLLTMSLVICLNALT